MKKKVIVFIIILAFIGTFSVTISLKDFFFTTKFYQEPLSAYNADAQYDPVYGDMTAKKLIGLFEIDSEDALLVGELTNDKFLVAEMKIKDKKYAYEGTVYLYSRSDVFNENSYNLTQTKTGIVKWEIINNKKDVDKLQNVKIVKEYSMSDKSPIFLVVFEQ